ncbi:MAG: universal stress protein [Deferrisomatales bacterium]
MPIPVLVSTDGSEPSRITETFAARLAQVLPLELTLAHVIDLHSLEYKMIPDFQVEMIRDAARKTAEALLEKEASFFRELGVAVRPRLLVGDPGPTLCEFAQREGMAAVITGRRGQGDLQDLLFGSVSNYVVHHCPVPVLIVKKAGRLPEPAEWSRPVRALVAVDGSEASRRCLEFLAARTEAAAGLQLVLLHVVNPKASGLEHLPDEARYEALSALHGEAQALLDGEAEGLRAAGFAVETRVEEGTAGRTICRIHEEDAFDLVIMGRRGLGEVSDILFGSVCHYVVHHCPGHVLVVP